MHGSVLVIDDDRAIRDSLQDLLALEGYRVVTAEHGRAGLDVLASGVSPCVVLLDLMMPVMNGPEFLSERARLGSAEAPVIVVTAFQDGAGDLPVEHIVLKPVDIDVLLELVARYCRADARTS